MADCHVWGERWVSNYSPPLKKTVRAWVVWLNSQMWLDSINIEILVKKKMHCCPPGNVAKLRKLPESKCISRKQPIKSHLIYSCHVFQDVLYRSHSLDCIILISLSSGLLCFFKVGLVTLVFHASVSFVGTASIHMTSVVTLQTRLWSLIKYKTRS